MEYNNLRTKMIFSSSLFLLSLIESNITYIHTHTCTHTNTYRWFHGFLTLEETKKFLEFQPVGTFLMRFSSSKPGSFALAFASAPHPVNPNQNQVTHVMIKTTPRGFSIQEENSEKYFDHVSQIVSYYSTVLTKPFASTLPEEV